MAKKATGFLTDDNTFYETKDEAEYHENIIWLRSQLREFLSAYEIPKDTQERITTLYIEFSKREAADVITLLEGYLRIAASSSNETVRQPPEGTEGLREQVGNVEPSGMVEDTNAKSSTKNV